MSSVQPNPRDDAENRLAADWRSRRAHHTASLSSIEPSREAESGWLS